MSVFIGDWLPPEEQLFGKTTQVELQTSRFAFKPTFVKKPHCHFVLFVSIPPGQSSEGF
jgi:hypothetical protein